MRRRKLGQFYAVRGGVEDVTRHVGHFADLGCRAGAAVPCSVSGLFDKLDGTTSRFSAAPWYARGVRTGKREQRTLVSSIDILDLRHCDRARLANAAQRRERESSDLFMHAADRCSTAATS